MTELAKWDSFYVIVGSSAGALIGLQFVVLTLIAQRPAGGEQDAGAAFATPTVVHFTSALFLAAMLRAPWQTVTSCAILWGVLGFYGLIYCVIVTRRLHKQEVYKPVFEDWLFHTILPYVAYGLLAFSPFTVGWNEHKALFAVGAASLLLLFIGIHNTWDGLEYHVFTRLRKKGKPPDSTADQSTNEKSPK